MLADYCLKDLPIMLFRNKAEGRRQRAEGKRIWLVCSIHSGCRCARRALSRNKGTGNREEDLSLFLTFVGGGAPPVGGLFRNTPKEVMVWGVGYRLWNWHLASCSEQTRQ